MEVIKNSFSNHARVTKIFTSHGEITTPAFMPVATRAFINNINASQIKSTNSQIILGGNTYHMLCNPGCEIIKKMGGMHKFMAWNGPMLTDSGGYQVFSLSKNKKICKIDENGAKFKHPKTGKIITLSPRESIETQKIIGADIIMAFDQCTNEADGIEGAMKAMERTHRWLLECKELQSKNPNSAYGYKQQLFGIIQGGSFRKLREESTKFINSLDLDGIAIGGEVIGFDMPKTCEIISWIIDELPSNKTRYTMGVGLNPQDILDVTAQGIDIFDCVAPTRNARHGALYVGKVVPLGNWLKFVSDQENSRILIKKAIYADDERPICEYCHCPVCQTYTRSYLHHLFKENAPLFTNLASIHNVYKMQYVCEEVRKFIMQ